MVFRKLADPSAFWIIFSALSHFIFNLFQLDPHSKQKTQSNICIILHNFQSPVTHCLNRRARCNMYVYICLGYASRDVSITNPALYRCKLNLARYSLLTKKAGLLSNETINQKILSSELKLSGLHACSFFIFKLRPGLSQWAKLYPFIQ